MERIWGSDRAIAIIGPVPESVPITWGQRKVKVTDPSLSGLI